MMDMLDIYKHARNSLSEIEMRQCVLCSQYMDTKKAPEWRAKYNATKAKREWLDKVIAAWEGSKK